jgi:hypothetical protein
MVKELELMRTTGTMHGAAPAYKLLGCHALPSSTAEIASFVGTLRTTRMRISDRS